MKSAAPVWRGAYSQGEAETEAFFESVAEYAVGGGGGRGPGLGRAGNLAYTAALGSLSGGVPLAQIGAVCDADFSGLNLLLHDLGIERGAGHQFRPWRFARAGVLVQSPGQAPG